MTKKQELINDIQKLLNGYDDKQTTFINPVILEYMDENELIKIIDDLLKLKEDIIESNKEWLEKFKKNCY